MGLAGTSDSEHTVFLARETVVVNKEPFEFASKFFAEIVNRFYVGPVMGLVEWL
jgi:hypothetical protein